MRRDKEIKRFKECQKRVAFSLFITFILNLMSSMWNETCKNQSLNHFSSVLIEIEFLINTYFCLSSLILCKLTRDYRCRFNEFLRIIKIFILIFFFCLTWRWDNEWHLENTNRFDWEIPEFFSFFMSFDVFYSLVCFLISHFWIGKNNLIACCFTENRTVQLRDESLQLHNISNFI